MYIQNYESLRLCNWTIIIYNKYIILYNFVIPEIINMSDSVCACYKTTTFIYSLLENLLKFIFLRVNIFKPVYMYLSTIFVLFYIYMNK